MNLGLNQLVYLETTSIPGIMGEQKVSVQMWVVDRAVPFELRAMEGDNVFLITTKEPLSKGVYAFQYQGLLADSEPGTLDKVPDEMRTVFPFEIP